MADHVMLDEKAGKARPDKGKDASGEAGGHDWSNTLFLPKTDFPMKAGLPEAEPRLIERWQRIGLYKRLREDAKGREKFILHDGPPYANGHLHIGHALNKILKDVVTRSRQMMGYDSNYVPGWDCHGLPIEWKIEEEYRAKGRNKDEVPVNEFRKECREFAEKWIGVQRQEFMRLGVEGDWWNPYTTMAFAAEATIASEVLKFAMNGTLFRGSKPVMWSVVEKTALAEAEIEYQDYQSDTIWVKFAVVDGPKALVGVPVVIWTTTPWTIPGNRAISFASQIEYGLYEVTKAPTGNWAKEGDRLILADKLAADVMKSAKVEAFDRRGGVDPRQIVACAHPLRGKGYDFDVPLLDGDHVTDDAGTGFVHTAPGHGTDDFDAWMASEKALKKRGIDTAIPFTVDADGFFTREAPGFTGARVLTDKGEKGDANEKVIKALADAGALIARGRLKHQYPHSWRSKKPIIFRNTPQWFIGMDVPVATPGTKGRKSIRRIALKAIDDTTFYPPGGQNRLRGMIEVKPDWVVSRQRHWGVPLCVFMHKETGEFIPNAAFKRSQELIDRIVSSFKEKGGDAWYEEGAAERYLTGIVADPSQWEQVRDTVEVWFDSGSTHAFVLEARPNLKWPASMYLEGSDQHRGWFHSSLIESCGTRGRAPYDAVLTHGFVMDENGHKMSKSLGNVVAPQDVMAKSGAEILRLWVMSSDYSDDLRVGPEILKANVESYRKLRNTLRWMLGNLAHFSDDMRLEPKQCPELERYMLHLLSEQAKVVAEGYRDYDFRRVLHTLSNFCINDLSAFYFDIRKDTLYCDPHSSPKRRAALTVIEEIFNCLTAWLAPMLPFTMEEAWLARHPSDAGSVHLRLFPEVPKGWKSGKLAGKWAQVRDVRRVVTGALEIERRERRIGSSLEAAPEVHIDDADLAKLLKGIDLAEISITSDAKLIAGPVPACAFKLDDVRHVGVVPRLATGRKCERSWRIRSDIGADAAFPTLSKRDAAAVREWQARGAGA